MTKNTWKTGFALTIIASLLIGCGDSDDSGVSAASLYTGPTEEIVLDSTNATSLVNNAVAATSSASSIDPSSALFKSSLSKEQPTIIRIAEFVKDAATNRLSSLSSKPIISGVTQSIDENCDVTGSFSATVTMVDQYTFFSQGDSISASYSNCSDDGIETLNGSISLTFSSVSGDEYSGGAYELGMTMSLNNFTTSSSTESFVGHGDLTMVMGTDAASISYFTMSGSELYTFDGSREMLLEDYRLATTSDWGVETTSDIDMTIASTDLGGSITIETTTPLSTLGWDSNPSSGSMTFTGANSAKVKLDVIDNASVTISWDVDPIDGDYEGSSTVASSTVF
ncbi:MAG: hypothetical protein GQ470_04965 [Gammaproteobacteria bacterium]|nr:hypothetical protein [Gammaproteobacteria bacterium]